MKKITLLVALVAALSIASPAYAHDDEQHPPVDTRNGHLVLGTHSELVRDLVTNWDVGTGYATEFLFGRGVQPLRVDFVGSPAANGTGSGGSNYLMDIGGNDRWLKVCGDMAGDRVDAARAYNRETDKFMKTTVLSGPVGRCGANTSDKNREWHEGGSVFVPLGGPPQWETAHWVGPRNYH